MPNALKSFNLGLVWTGKACCVKEYGQFKNLNSRKAVFTRNERERHFCLQEFGKIRRAGRENPHQI